MRPVRLLPLLGALAIVVGLLEIAWRGAAHFSSPALGLLYPLVAIPIGWAAQRLACKESAEPTIGEAFLGGSVVLAWVYCLLLAFGARSLFPFVALALALASLTQCPLRALLEKRLPLTRIGLHTFIALLAFRNASYAEHLPLTEPAPRVFGWVDTSFWLNNAYGIERGLPVRDMLVEGGTLNYHFGGGLVVVGIRALTGLPMHLAHVVALAACGWSLALLLGRVAERIMGAKAGSLAVWCAPLVALAWQEKIIFNYPSAYATPLAVYALLRFGALRTFRAALLLVPTMALLMMTKESTFLFAGLFAGVMSLVALLRTRSWQRAAVLVAAGAGAKVLYGLFVEHGQKAGFTPFKEHFEARWLGSLVHEGFGVNGPLAGSPGFHHSHLWVLLVVGVLAAWGWRIRRTEPRRAWILASAVLAYGLGFGMLLALKPHHTPEYDPLHAGWVVGDMYQFLLNAEDIVVVIGALVALTVVDEALAEKGRAAVVAAAVVGLGFYDLTHAFTAPDPQRDLAQPVLEKVPVTGTIILASIPPFHHYPFNEHPDLPAFYGHQFYLLRHGRWATAQPRFQEMEKTQILIATTSDRNEALALARREGITHLLTIVWSVPPWLRETTPVFKNELWAVFDLRALPPSAL